MRIYILTILSLILCTQSALAESMKLEGSCTGNLSNGTVISYSYYSNYDGCKKVSRASVSFTAGIKGVYKGKRSFTDSQDVYALHGGYKLIFANSSGNTTGILVKPGETVKVQCKVRDYEYPEC